MLLYVQMENTLVIQKFQILKWIKFVFVLEIEWYTYVCVCVHACKGVQLNSKVIT